MSAGGSPSAVDTPQRLVILVGAMARGGAERAAATMAGAWAQAGRDVRLVATHLGTSQSEYALHAGVQFTPLAELLQAAGGPRWPVTLRKVRALRRLIDDLQPDCVISFLTNVNMLAIAALYGGRCPLIVSERVDPAADVELSWVLRAARPLVYHRADALVIQTRYAAERYRRRIRLLPPLAVLPNPLPAELASSALRAVQPDRGGCVIALGRLRSQKGYDRLIAAFHLALGEDPNWRLEIWGEGPERAALQRQIDSLSSGERMRLCGQTDAPWSKLAAAQLFALSSAYEGFPNAMLEAMAVGLPCVAFDCPSGPRELANDGRAAVLVPPKDTQALAQELRRMARDAPLRRELGARAAAFVRERFAQTTVMAGWDALIVSAIARHASRRARP